MTNILKSFYTILTAPVGVSSKPEEEENQEYWVDEERVSLFSALFGRLNSRGQSLSV